MDCLVKGQRKQHTNSREDTKFSRRFQIESFTSQLLSYKYLPPTPSHFISRNQSTEQSRSAQGELVQGHAERQRQNQVSCAAKLQNCTSSTMQPLQISSQGLQQFLCYLMAQRHKASPAELSVTPSPCTSQPNFWHKANTTHSVLRDLLRTL